MEGGGGVWEGFWGGRESQLRHGASDWAKFSWMLPLGVRDNHTNYEPETQRRRPGTGVASAGPPFQNLQFRAKIGLLLP